MNVKIYYKKFLNWKNYKYSYNKISYQIIAVNFVI